MKREKKWDKAQKLRALVVELNVAAEDMVEYNNIENDELYMLPSIVFSVRDIVREELRKVEFDCDDELVLTIEKREEQEEERPVKVDPFH